MPLSCLSQSGNPLYPFEVIKARNESKKRINSNRPPLKRGTVAIPLLCLTRENDITNCTPLKWWFV